MSTSRSLTARQIVDVFKEKPKRAGRGTSLLYASGKKVTSLLTSDGSSTMFSKVLLRVLSATGDPYRPDETYLSLHDIADLMEEALDRLLDEKGLSRRNSAQQ